jgi:hypothetical protein
MLQGLPAYVHTLVRRQNAAQKSADAKMARIEMLTHEKEKYVSLSLSYSFVRCSSEILSCRQKEEYECKIRILEDKIRVMEATLNSMKATRRFPTH